MGNFELSKMPSVVRRLCGQLSGGPRGEDSQLYVRTKAPISPPPERNFKLLVIGFCLIKLSNNHDTLQQELITGLGFYGVEIKT